MPPFQNILNNRSMDNLFLNRMNSWQGVVMKKQETIIFKDLKEKLPDPSI